MKKERTNVDAKTLAVKSDFGCIIAGISDTYKDEVCVLGDSKLGDAIYIDVSANSGVWLVLSPYLGPFFVCCWTRNGEKILPLMIIDDTAYYWGYRGASL